MENTLRISRTKDGAEIFLNDHEVPRVGKVNVDTDDGLTVATIEFLVHRVVVDGDGYLPGGNVSISAKGDAK